MLVKLLEMGFDPNATTAYADDKYTALHAAVRKNQISAVKILIKAGADADLYGNWSKNGIMIVKSDQYIFVFRIFCEEIHWNSSGLGKNEREF